MNTEHILIAIAAGFIGGLLPLLVIWLANRGD